MSATSPDPALLPEALDLGDARLTLRPMEDADRGAMLAFARSLPEVDLLFLRTDITREDVVERWLRDIASGQASTVVAVDGPRIVGYSSLHRADNLWTRHLGEILLLVGSAARGQGIGGRLARHVLELAKGLGLQKLVAQMTSTQRSAQNLFHRLGFIPEAMLHDWVIDRNGTTHNLIMMSREVDLDEDFLRPE